VKNPAVDTLVRTMVGAQTKAELLPACRALERVIAHSHYLIPQWNSTHYNVAYSAEKLAKPEAVPPYARAENWLMSTWWSRYPVPLLNLK
jgi:microcin C transport system substrate-binding protein